MEEFKELSKVDSIVTLRESRTDSLNKCIFQLNKLENEYHKKANELWVTTNFSEVIVESRPTVDMKKAYIDHQLSELVSEIRTEKANIEIFENQLKVIDLQIKAEMKSYDLVTAMYNNGAL